MLLGLHYLVVLSAKQKANNSNDSSPAEEPVKKKVVRRIGTPLEASDTDASAVLAPQNEMVVAAVFLLALVLICLVRGRRKNEAKTQ